MLLCGWLRRERGAIDVKLAEGLCSCMGRKLEDRGDEDTGRSIQFNCAKVSC